MILLALFVGVVIAILILAIGVGMLISGRITRWLERDDEEPHDR